MFFIKKKIGRVIKLEKGIVIYDKSCMFSYSNLIRIQN